VCRLTEPVLPDILEANLRIVFCGSAAGAASSRASAYYAGPGNKFWSILHKTRLTPYLLIPQQFTELANFRIGLTDLAKHASGSDADLPSDADDPAGLRELILQFEPNYLAFNGKRSGKEFIKFHTGSRSIDYGLQGSTVGKTAIFILPSTSGAANRYWDEAPWYALAQRAEIG